MVAFRGVIGYKGFQKGFLLGRLKEIELVFNSFPEKILCFCLDECVGDEACYGAEDLELIDKNST